MKFITKKLSEDLGMRRGAAKFGNWFFHHDNAPTHTGLAVWRFLTKNGMTLCSIHPIHPTLPLVTFFSPQNKK